MIKYTVGFVGWVLIIIFLHMMVKYFAHGVFSSVNEAANCVFYLAKVLSYPGFLFATIIWPGVHGGEMRWRVVLEMFNAAFYFGIILFFCSKIKCRSSDKLMKK
jgi:hypothetical protein